METVEVVLSPPGIMLFAHQIRRAVRSSALSSFLCLHSFPDLKHPLRFEPFSALLNTQDYRQISAILL